MRTSIPRSRDRAAFHPPYPPRSSPSVCFGAAFYYAPPETLPRCAVPGGLLFRLPRAETRRRVRARPPAPPAGIPPLRFPVPRRPAPRARPDAAAPPDIPFPPSRWDPRYPCAFPCAIRTRRGPRDRVPHYSTAVPVPRPPPPPAGGRPAGFPARGCPVFPSGPPGPASPDVSRSRIRS